jgi:hypothetical protein
MAPAPISGVFYREFISFEANRGLWPSLVHGGNPAENGNAVTDMTDCQPWLGAENQINPETLIPQRNT